MKFEDSLHSEHLKKSSTVMKQGISIKKITSCPGFVLEYDDGLVQRINLKLS